MLPALARRHFHCVAGARWKTSVPGGPSARRGLRRGDGSRALTNALLQLSPHTSLRWKTLLLYVRIIIIITIIIVIMPMPCPLGMLLHYTIGKITNYGVKTLKTSH